MKRTFIAIVAVIISSTSIFWACSKDSENDNIGGDLRNFGNIVSERDSVECFSIGQQLDNAYSLNNMQAAYQNLRQQGMSDVVNIHCTHYYVKFMPQTSTEFNLLINDTTLELFDYPLDYEIIGNETGSTFCYKNETDNSLYTVVPVNYQFPAVQYTILEECFIPQENATEAEERVEFESLRMTGNLTSDEISDTLDTNSRYWWRLPSKKRPQGYIKVWNTKTFCYEPIKFVKVRTRKLVKIGTAYTNANGYYQSSRSFRFKCLYSISYDNLFGFKIWGNIGPLAPALFYIGKHDRAGHNHNISNTSIAFKWSTINNAVIYYKHTLCPHFGIMQPPSKLRFWSLPLNNGWSGNAVMGHQMSLSPIVITNFILGTNMVSMVNSTISMILPDICIFKDVTDTKRYYSCVFHEMAHSSHFKKVGIPYWIQYVNAVTFSGGYGNTNNANAGYIGVGEMWGYFFEYKCNQYCFNNDTTIRLGGANEWFQPQILQDLCNFETLNLTPAQIFNCLTLAVTDHTLLKNKLKDTYGNNLVIDSIFANYGF